MLGFVLAVVLIVFVTPWRWLKRGLALLALFFVHVIILDAQVPCGDFGCGLVIGITLIFWVFVLVVCLLRYFLIKWKPAVAMADVGESKLWIGDFCVAAGGGSVGALLVFIWLIWALAGGNSEAAHWGLAFAIVVLIGLAVWVGLRWGVVASGLVAGVAVMFAIGGQQSLWFPEKVLAAAQKKARGHAYCIYFPMSDRFYRDGRSLTLLTMEKSRDAHRYRHAILVWDRDGTLRTAFWSFGRERFVDGYQYCVHPVPADMEARFRRCLEDKV